ncbi:MAG TPA: hypothetical protein VFW19_11975 [Allosphingosinicella sp.]|nr:hypothetical protein [Allosphingosinicella sp.]
MATVMNPMPTSVPAAGSRRPWRTPVVRRLNAGAAENGAGAVSDDPINFS